MQQMQGWWHDQCQGLLCDVRVRATVADVVQQCVKHWGRIDIIVNCTGYGVIGACEDQDDCDLRSQFETNFMGTLNIIQLSLPLLREQAAAAARQDDHHHAGRYIIFSSTSGALGVPGLGPYCATKYATEGLIESMLYEIDAFGIKASLVEPGHMRIDEPTGLDDKAADDSSFTIQKYGHFLVKTPSAPYDTPTAPAGHARRVVQWLSDRQPTSAVKSAELVWQLGHCKYPPLRLLLGTYAIESVRDRLKSVIEEIEDWKHLHFPTSVVLVDDHDDDDDDKGRASKGNEAEGEGEAEGEAEGEEHEDERDDFKDDEDAMDIAEDGGDSKGEDA